MPRLGVYGTLRKGEGNHDFLRGCEYVGEKRLEGYSLHDAGYFPYAVREDGSEITIEIYDVEDVIIDHCDMLEGHPNHYRRTLVSVDGHPTFVYVAAQEEEVATFHEKIEGGDWMNR